MLLLLRFTDVFVVFFFPGSCGFTVVIKTDQDEITRLVRARQSICGSQEFCAVMSGNASNYMQSQFWTNATKRKPPFLALGLVFVVLSFLRWV